MFMRFQSFLLALTALAVPAALSAGRVKTWHHHGPSHQEKATLKNVVVSSEGALSLSRKVRTLAKLDAAHVWALAEDRAGNLYAATGEDGKVFQVTPTGKVSVAAKADSSQVLSLAVDAKGEAVYAGTGPTGEVLRIDAAGAKVLCKLPAKYIWSLAVEPRTGALYAATGPSGRIYKVSAEGKASLFYDTKQDHVLCLAAGPDGTLYAGTDRTGRVYRIDGKGKGFVLYQAAQSEVRTLLVADKALYVGTSATKRRGSGTASGGSTGTAKRDIPAALEAVRASSKEVPAKLASTKGESSKSKEPTKGEKAKAPAAPTAGENSIYRIALDGPVREVFREKALVMGLLPRSGGLFAGTGMLGQVFEIDEATRDRTEVARLDHGQVLCLLRRKDGSVVLGTGDPGTLYVMEDRHAAEGTVTSEVLDAKLVSKWGALRWRADVPAKTGVTIAARSGNVSEPDDTWSDWGEEQTDAAKATVSAPAARYLQYRVTLKSDDGAVSPTLHSLTLSYATGNQAPEVTKVEVPDLSATTLKTPKRLELKWTATDANEDELRYRLLIKKDSWDRWVEIEDDLDRNEYEWDTTTTPSGVYRLKVVASDHVDNAPGEALTGERVSAPFVVCHTPPSVTVKTAGLAGGAMSIEATATSPLVRLTGASFSVNGKKWEGAFPTDGLFDGRTEAFRFTTGKLKPGTYVVVLKVTDAAGNVGTGDVVFTVPGKP